MIKEDKNFQFWTKYLKSVSLVISGLGAFWAISGMFDPFGIYDRAFAQAFWQSDVLPRQAERTMRFILGPLGATCAAYFLMQYYLASHAFARKEIWGYKAIIIPFIIWFLLDSTISLVHGAYFNIYLANIPALVLMIPVFYSYKYFRN